VSPITGLGKLKSNNGIRLIDFRSCPLFPYPQLCFSCCDLFLFFIIYSSVVRTLLGRWPLIDRVRWSANLFRLSTTQHTLHQNSSLRIFLVSGRFASPQARIWQSFAVVRLRDLNIAAKAK